MSFITPTSYLSLPALVHNFRVCCRRAEGASIICTVKADAYGHGAVACTGILLAAGATAFAVANAHEAFALAPFFRRDLCKERLTYKDAHPYLLILGPVEPRLLFDLSSLDTVLSIHSLPYATALSKTLDALKKKRVLRENYLQPVAIKAETGMHRLGFSHTGAALAACRLPHLLPVTLYSHLGEGASVTGRTYLQARAFERWSRALRGEGVALQTHLSASGALFRFGTLGADAARVGLALYGALPDAASPLLLPVMRLCARVLSVKTVRAGAGVGYGNFRLSQKTRVAILGIGYADGIPVTASGAALEIKGRCARIIGEVCMDRTLLDVGDIPLREGEEVTLFGDENTPVNRFARECKTSVYHILSVRSPRTQRVYVSS